MENYDNSKYALGVLCRRKHEYENSGKTLRLISNSTCPICSKIYTTQYRIDNKDSISLRDKKYKRENADKIKQYRADTAERSSAYSKQYYIQNKTHINRRNAQWMNKNKKHISDWHKTYAKTEKGKFNVNRANHNYRTRKRNNGGNYTKSEWDETLIYFENTCAYCSGPVEHKDHLHPIVAGGTNYIHNLVPSCSACNFSKNLSLIDDWYPKQTFYDYDKHIKLNEYVTSRYHEEQFRVTV